MRITLTFSNFLTDTHLSENYLLLGQTFLIFSTFKNPDRIFQEMEKKNKILN